MRLIDADALMKATKKEMRYVEKHAIPYEDMDTGHMVGLRWAERAIANAPTIDAVPVVLCKDCKWWTKQEASIQGRCALAGIYPTGGWYCGNGERKDDES